MPPRPSHRQCPWTSSRRLPSSAAFQYPPSWERVPLLRQQVQDLTSCVFLRHIRGVHLSLVTYITVRWSMRKGYFPFSVSLCISARRSTSPFTVVSIFLYLSSIGAWSFFSLSTFLMAYLHLQILNFVLPPPRHLLHFLQSQDIPYLQGLDC